MHTQTQLLFAGPLFARPDVVQNHENRVDELQDGGNASQDVAVGEVVLDLGSRR